MAARRQGSAKKKTKTTSKPAKTVKTTSQSAKAKVASKPAKAKATSKPVKAKVTSKSPKKTKGTTPGGPHDVESVLKWLERHGSKANRDGMARYAIVAEKVYGVSVGTLRTYAKTLGRDHALAAALWDTGWYEARMLASFVDDPALVTPAQMDRWCRDFDNWAICDTVCFHLFDRTPHIFSKVEAWAKKPREFEKRAAFALLASAALHGRAAEDDEFLRCLPWIEAAAADERNFVKKGVSWALRGVGRRNAALNRAAVAVAERLAAATGPARWVGKDALRELTSPAVLRRF